MNQFSPIVIKNIYYMLSYVFDVLRQGNYENMQGEQYENFHELLSAILACGMTSQIRRGLHREYVEHMEDLSSVRGKIDLPATIQNVASGKRLIRCSHDEFSKVYPVSST